MARTILTPEQMEDEYKAIKKLGPFENLLLVTGENPAKAGVPYLAKALDIAKKILQQPEDRSDAPQSRGIRRAEKTRTERRHLLSGNLQQSPLQRISSAWNEI